MVFKVNISEKSGKTWKLETESEELLGKALHDKLDGKEFYPDLAGYEFEITGTSDKSGFTSSKDVEGVGLKKVLLTYGKGMHKKPKGDKKTGTKPRGLRLRKTVRGKVISEDTRQVNTKITKVGAKKLADIFAKPAEGEEAPKTE